MYAYVHVCICTCKSICVRVWVGLVMRACVYVCLYVYLQNSWLTNSACLLETQSVAMLRSHIVFAVLVLSIILLVIYTEMANQANLVVGPCLK